jgi:ATP-dependent RNA helicase DeaD
MGISVPTPIQRLAIPPLLEGRDLVGQAQTGSGKTLAFALPIVQQCDPYLHWTQAMVLTPTRELAIQVGGVLEQLAGDYGLSVALLYGGTSMPVDRQRLAAGQHIVVGTPGRTLDHLWRGTLIIDRLRILILDEGDEMLDQGFALEVEKILWLLPQERQTALFSATIPDWIAATVARHLTNPVEVRADRELEPPPEIEHIVYELQQSTKFDALTDLLDQRDGAAILVFGRTKYGVTKLAHQLRQRGYPVAELQGDLSQPARERALGAFRSGRLPILCATNVAARGLDVEGIAQVINYELPESAELFTHRVGRTGRMGRPGESITFVTPEDAYKLRLIERALGRRLPRARSNGAAASAAPSHSAPPVAAPKPRRRWQRAPRPTVRPA